MVQSEDKRKLFDIFEQLWNCKNDEQQRSWPVHEDEDHIGTLLSDMNTILVRFFSFDFIFFFFQCDYLNDL